MKKQWFNRNSGLVRKAIPKSKSLILILAAISLNVLAQNSYIEPVRVTVSPAITDAITIDGLDNESSWGPEESMSDPFMTTDWYGDDDLSGYFKTCWDIDHFYFFARVTDDISHGWDGVEGSWWEFDYVWLYFNMDSSLADGTEYFEDATNIAFNRELPYQFAGELSWNEDRAALDEMDFIVENSSGYYTVEAAIPWVYFLPGPVEAIEPDDIYDWLAKAMGFDVHFVDSDGDDPWVGVRSAHAAWDTDFPDEPNDLTEDQAWNNTSVFGILSLTGDINMPPVADAGPDQEVTEGDEVTLDGTGSYDPEGEDLSYTWIPTGGITLSDIHASNPTFTAPEVPFDANYPIGLRVNDGTGTSTIDYVTIHVIQKNVAPIANAGADQTVNERELVVLNGSVSTDFDGDPLSYQWTSLQATGIIGATTVSPMLVAPEVLENDSFQFVLTVSDGEYFSPPDTMNLFVNSMHDAYDTVVVYDTVYMVETVTHHNTILISLVDTDGNLVAREVDGDLYVELFPNPADQFINIRSDITVLEVEILDIEGTVVKSQIVNATEAELNLGGLSAGTYMLRLHTETGMVNKQMVLE